jgi:hypothetical protein
VPPHTIGNGVPSGACKLARREQSVRLQNIDQMMRNSAPLVRAQFGRADIEMAIYLERIAVDDFSLERLGQKQRQIAFPRSGGSHQRNHRAPRSVFL